MFVSWRPALTKLERCSLRCRRPGKMDPNAVRIFVKLDSVRQDALVNWLRQIVKLVVVIVFAVRRRPRGSGARDPTAAGLISKLTTAGVSRQNCFLFTTETLTDVAPDALLTLLYAKYCGRRNYLVTERADGERRRWFQELLKIDPNVKTVWMTSDFRVQS